MKTSGVVVVTIALLVFGATAMACGDDDDDDANDDDGEATAVDVTLREFEIAPAKDSAPAGNVTFRASNVGPNDAHELVVIRTDLEPGDLPKDETGKVDEEQLDALGEIEEFAVGGTEEVTLNLTSGSYVLICNIVEETDGTTESHYINGMRTAFTVE